MATKPFSQQAPPSQSSASATLQARLASANEASWIKIGAICDMMNELDKAAVAYEYSLRHNPYNIQTLTAIANIFRKRENWAKAAEYLQRAVKADPNNGETWATLAYTYLLSDDLQNAYTAYQHALFHLPNPKDSQVWYGIGMLYERCGSFEHAEEAFSGVLKMDPHSDKKPEILFRLGTIYKQTAKYMQSLECFRCIVNAPPAPRTAADVWLQMGHIYELQKEYDKAMDAYQNGMKENPNHPKLLQHVAWLRLLDSPFQNVGHAIVLLIKAAELDPNDAQTWYILGRCQVGTREFSKAHYAYQQAVYRDERNPTLWCSIGILYYKIGQYKEALDAYSKAIRFNPYMSAVWYNLGTLYESCKQPPDAKDAYQHALELDADNMHIRERLHRLQLAIEKPLVNLDELPPLPAVMEPVPIRALESLSGPHALGHGAGIDGRLLDAPRSDAPSSHAGSMAPMLLDAVKSQMQGGSVLGAADVARKMEADPLRILDLPHTSLPKHAPGGMSLTASLAGEVSSSNPLLGGAGPTSASHATPSNGGGGGRLGLSLVSPDMSASSSSVGGGASEGGRSGGGSVGKRGRGEDWMEADAALQVSADELKESDPARKDDPQRIEERDKARDRASSGGGGGGGEAKKKSRPADDAA